MMTVAVIAGIVIVICFAVTIAHLTGYASGERRQKELLASRVGSPFRDVYLGAHEREHPFIYVLSQDEWTKVRGQIETRK